LYVSDIELTQYRNFSNIHLEFSPGLSIISGNNGEGKTNLLESLYLISIGKSFRARNDFELIRHKSPDQVNKFVSQTTIHGVTKFADEKNNIVIALPSDTNQSKEIKFNGINIAASQLVGKTPTVLFTAHDMDIVLGSPGKRRQFLDILISQVNQEYLIKLQKYQQILTQRNSLLKAIRDHQSSEDELLYWNTELIELGKFIIMKRAEIIKLIDAEIQGIHSEFSSSEKLSFQYIPSVTIEKFEETLNSTLRQQILMGITDIGPQRDNILIQINGISAYSFSSRGQAKNIVLSLRLSEAKIIQSTINVQPILLLDDILSELDEFRRKKIIEKMRMYNQSIVTTPEPDLIDSTYANNIINLQNGEIQSD